MVFLGVGKISNIFLGCLKFLVFFKATIVAGCECTHEAKM